MDLSSAKEAAVNRTCVKPFLKWAGGKGQLLKEIEQYYPFGNGITKYAEPFVGGGAVLFDILSKYDIQEIYISDINAELINTYCVIRDAIHELVELLSLYQSEYSAFDSAARKEYYLDKRSRFNHLKEAGSPQENIEKAALMIFLNKTCFNGLYRVNRKGLFNVPIGSYKNPLICDEDNLRAISEKLQHVTIVCGDYRQSADFIDEHTFAYFDPPYRPITDTARFTAYTENLFDDAEQIQLARFVEEMHQKGARVVISNSDPKNLDAGDDFFERIYAPYQIRRVEASRMINCNSDARGKIKELLISNFQGGTCCMKIAQGTQCIDGGQKTAIIEFRFADYTIYVFQGDLSPNDILIKYKKGNSRIRTPKHIHWVVDVLMKLQGDEKRTRNFLLAIQDVWKSCTPLSSNDGSTLKQLIVHGETSIEIEHFSSLNRYGEYDVEFLYVLMELLAVQEKTNNANAYMFGNILKELLKPERDIFKIVSTAGFGGRKG